MSSYNLNIDVNSTSLKALKASNMLLYAFKGVNSPANVASTIWFKEDSLYEKNNLTWEVKHDVYISAKDNIDVGTKVVSSTTRSTDAGGTANVNDDNTIDLDKSKGIPMFYSFLNTGVKPHTCGLSSLNPKGVSVPICATILHGGNAVGIEPIEKVYLVFSNALHQEGTVLMQTSAPGYIVDVTDESMQGATVNFDIETGWTCKVPAQKGNCTPVAANVAFANVLNSK
eukprot:gene26291-32853_t